MKQFLEIVFLDNSLRSYLYVVLAIFLAFLLKRFVSRYAAGLLFKIVKKVADGVDKVSFVNLVVAPPANLPGNTGYCCIARKIKVSCFF